MSPFSQVVVLGGTPTSLGVAMRSKANMILNGIAYEYVLNNPVGNKDPNGLINIPPGSPLPPGGAPPPKGGWFIPLQPVPCKLKWELFCIGHCAKKGQEGFAYCFLGLGADGQYYVEQICHCCGSL